MYPKSLRDDLENLGYTLYRTNSKIENEMIDEESAYEMTRRNELR